MIDKALEAKILRYHFVEQWGVNTIARQLGLHHTTVDRVLSQAGLPKAERTRRSSIVDPYHPMIIETLAQFPTLSAARLLEMARVLGELATRPRRGVLLLFTTAEEARLLYESRRSDYEMASVTVALRGDEDEEHVVTRVLTALAGATCGT